jgi:biopolymer transport protein TolR
MGITTNGSKDGLVADPNIVPLIDVLLVLIIIFLVITPKVPTGLPTLAPQPAPQSSKPEPPDPRVIVVEIREGGKLLINQEPTDWDALAGRMFDIFKERADKVAFVEGDGQVPFSQVARAIDIMRGAGIDHIGLIPAAKNLPKGSF